MFFPHFMTIEDDDLVLEIGPGAYPYWRSDCLVDVYDNTSGVDLSQFGGAPLRTLGKPFYKMEENTLPFHDNSFDYIICSHVLEHVDAENIHGLIKEIRRVAKRTYIEIPRVIYEYIYNINSHVNIMEILNDEIIILPKHKTHFMDVKNFSLYALTLRKKYDFSIELLDPYLVAAGKEFDGEIPITILDNEKDFFNLLENLTLICKKPSLKWRINDNLKKVIWKVKKKKGISYFNGLLR